MVEKASGEKRKLRFGSNLSLRERIPKLTATIFFRRRFLQSVPKGASLPAHFGNLLAGGSQPAGMAIYIVMSVKIRMKRVGAKNAPVFRIVVADSRSPRDGKFIEELGTYQPLQKGENFKFDLDRANYWLSKGAQPSETVASFIKQASRAAAA